MYALAVHGGAGTRSESESSPERSERCRRGLSEALERGQSILERGGSALEAVEAAVIALEDDPLFNAGRGAVLTLAGGVELDAAIMEGATLRAGAVAQVRRVRNPIRLARQLLERSAHVFLVGDGADRYALELGLESVPNEYFVTPERQQQLAALRAALAPADASSPNAALRSAARQPTRRTEASGSAPLGTVGAVARDRIGGLAAATSTGGTAGQQLGRVGDSPVIGAGTYADDESCAVSTTGQGEAFLRTVLAYDISARMRYRGQTLAVAVERAIGERLSAVGGRGGVIAVNPQGEIVIRHNSATLAYGYVIENGMMHLQAW
jgi:beta-aspartyl-peptidase (threonine type)